MTGFIQVSSTVNNRLAARRIAQELLQARLASCVQILGPIESSYWWKGKLEREKEWLLLIKARADDYRRIEAAIKKTHPYKIPEILAFTILYGNPDYLDWTRNETSRRTRNQAE
ncbi:MAG TPA: divalent-cation tolerance protein CutA [Candidatus Dormibacteraeota bacterium]|nr:divalent-cation tolerance protein CutA [Candidatus Dormibacteraeota bacterium]